MWPWLFRRPSPPAPGSVGMDILHGAGLAMDPLPAPRRSTFIPNDGAAFLSDQMALDADKAAVVFPPY